MSEPERRAFFKKFGIGFLSLSLPYNWFSKLTKARGNASTGAYFTTGFRISEVTGDTLIAWTRLCARDYPNPVRHERTRQEHNAIYARNYYPADFDEDQPVALMDGGVPGIPGMARAIVDDGKDRIVSGWHEAVPQDDYAVKIPVKGLKAGRSYKIRLEAGLPDKETVFSTEGTFRTLPGKDDISPVLLTTATCQYFWNYDDRRRGFKTYDSMRRLKPDLFIHTGDYVYYDRPGPLAGTVEKARHQWHAMNSRPSIRDFCKEVPVYMMKDDHDLLKDDAYPGIEPYGKLSFEEGLKVWYEQVAVRDKPYRTIRWGKDLQIWIVEGREYRSQNTKEDSLSKSIWGEEQINWFKETVATSDATFKLLFSATPVVGPDRENKRDNHANKAFQFEGEWLREHLSRHGMFVVSGDRHWQYMSEDAATGLVEFGAGPVSDVHAGGWDENDRRPEHRFLRVKGGFLGIKVDRKNRMPFIEFNHYDVEGSAVNTYRHEEGEAND